jgi:hypothetical protein
MRDSLDRPCPLSRYQLHEPRTSALPPQNHSNSRDTRDCSRSEGSLVSLSEDTHTHRIFDKGIRSSAQEKFDHRNVHWDPEASEMERSAALLCHERVRDDEEQTTHALFLELMSALPSNKWQIISQLRTTARSHTRCRAVSPDCGRTWDRH